MDIKHILIDEFQFLQMDTSEVKAFFDKYENLYNFYIFGLNMNYRRAPFKLVASVMAMADEIEVIGGYCDICGKVPSRYSLRLENNKPANIKEEGQVILLDGTDLDEVKIDYLSVCKDCWNNIYKKGE